MSHTLTREAFYDLIWSKPMTHIAKDFCLSDVALHKICKKHGIPKPPQGWWNKKAAGHAVIQTPLPPRQSDQAGSITITSGEVRDEPEAMATARDHARVFLSSIAPDAQVEPHRIVARTVARLAKVTGAPPAGLVSTKGSGLITAEVAPASIERLELALNRIAAAALVLGIELVAGDEAAQFVCDGETIAFSVTEGVRREKHVPTDAERAKLEAWESKQARYWSRRNPWDDGGLPMRPAIPEWDHHPTGQLTFAFDTRYHFGSAPRRSFRDARTQRLELMAGEIAAGIAVVAAAMKEDRRAAEERTRKLEDDRRQREEAQRAEFIRKRREEALDRLLEEVASLERMRRFVGELRNQITGGDGSRVSKLVELAERRLSEREATLSVGGLERRLESDRLFGDDDGQGFRPQGWY